MEINQIVPTLAYGDAISNHVLEINKLLHSWGHRAAIYANSCHRRYTHLCEDYRQYKGSPHNILIFHYGIGSEIDSFVRQLPDHTILYYHNITPAYFLRGVNRKFANQLEQGRQQLSSFKNIPSTIAASEYNRQELLELGFENVAVAPYILDFTKIKDSAESKAGLAIRKKYDDGAVNLLFIGRVVPNKCQADLIKSFNYYHKLVNPNSRLLIVGSATGTERYHLYLEYLVKTLGLEGSVHFCGHVGLNEGLGAYYKVASVFVCMSEHEGFCVPLLESAYFDVPIVAYKSTGVAYTLANAGILVKEKRYGVVAELIEMLNTDSNFRASIVSAQHHLLEEYSREKSIEQLYHAIFDNKAVFDGQNSLLTND